MPPTKTSDATAISIPELDTKEVVLRLRGDSPLITHAWSEKAKQMMRDKQQGKSIATREPKNPTAEYESAFYRMPDGKPAMRTIAFKAAVVDAATQLTGVTKVFLRGAFHVMGELVEIQGDDPIMREDMVRVGMGTADIRYRPEFTNWYVDLVVRYNAKTLTLSQIVQLFNQAGFSTGIGEWRPQKDGSNGLFSVKTISSAMDIAVEAVA